MSMQDPISDMLTRIRNAQLRTKKSVSMPLSKHKHAIANLMLEEGYVSAVSIDETDGQFKQLVVDLKYYQGKPVIDSLKRVSRPGLRIYKSCDELPKVANGLGIAIISTSSGLMTDKTARKMKIGGEVLCVIC